MELRLALPVLLSSAAILAPCRAQTYTYLTGFVRDPSGASVPGAVVSAVNAETGFRREALSRTDGRYAVVSLEPGLYKVTARKEGFRTLIRLGVRLEVAQPARVDFTLPLGSLEEAITVEASPPVLHSEDAAVGTRIGSAEILRLPLNGRGLLSLLELAPGTVVTPATRGEPGQFSSAGQRPNTNYFTVDGVSANTGVSAGGVPAQSTGGSLPAMTALGSLHSVLSLEAIDEFRIQTATTPAEFGRLPGAHVILSSRSGTNEFHGSASGYARQESFDANDWFANRAGEGRAPARLRNFGASLGGPLKRNLAFFFLAYEGLRVRQPFAWRTASPATAVRAGAPAWVVPLLDLFPAPNGPELGGGLAEWTGRNSRPSRLDASNLRLDHALTSRVTLFGRFSHVPSRSEFGGAQISRVSIKSRSLTLGLNARLKPGAAFDFRANLSAARLGSTWTPLERPASSTCDLEPVLNALLSASGACDYLFRLSIAGAGRVVFGREGDQRQRQLHLAPAVVMGFRSHQIRLGGDYLQLSPSRRDYGRTLGVIAESLPGMLERRGLWTAVSEPLAREGTLEEAAAFFQDTWRISRRLTASLGLRWEFTPAPELKSELTPFIGVPVDAYSFRDQTSIWRRTYRNFAPRAGLAWQPREHGRTVLRAGWGLYYDSSFSIATDLVNGGPFSLSQFSGSAAAPFSSQLLTYGFQPGLLLPSVAQWSAGAERAFGPGQVFSAVYVGSSGRRLLRREMGGPESNDQLRVALATNHGSSAYHGLQLQCRLQTRRGLDGAISYAWSHSIDDSSTDHVLHWAGSGLTASGDRGSSDFDVRHALTAALGFQMPRRAGGWRLDGILRARSGFPLTVLSADYSMGLTFANVFRPDWVGGAPLWIEDSLSPGGRRLNRDAFRPAASLVQGNLGRNSIPGFGMHQIDLALSREFPLAKKGRLQVRIEAFNVLNHPSFSDPTRFLSSPLFGQSPSMLNLMLGTGSPGSGLTPLFQTGGARSMQAMVRLRF